MKKRANLNLITVICSLLLLVICQGVSAFVVSSGISIVNDKVFLGLTLNNYWAVAINLAVIIVALIYLVKKTYSVVLCLLIVAVLSNLLDRLFYGGVVDYFSFLTVPNFNLADIVITISAAYLCLCVIKQKTPR